MTYDTLWAGANQPHTFVVDKYGYDPDDSMLPTNRWFVTRQTNEETRVRNTSIDFGPRIILRRPKEEGVLSLRFSLYVPGHSYWSGIGCSSYACPQMMLGEGDITKKNSKPVIHCNVTYARPGMKAAKAIEKAWLEHGTRPEFSV